MPRPFIPKFRDSKYRTAYRTTSHALKHGKVKCHRTLSAFRKAFVQLTHAFHKCSFVMAAGMLTQERQQ
jgi:hypothetical protein